VLRVEDQLDRSEEVAAPHVGPRDHVADRFVARRILDRRNALDRLIAHALDAIRADPDDGWLRLVLRKGFAGFENMSRAQLARELQLRGLQPPIETGDDASALEDDFSDDWDLSHDLPDLPGGMASDTPWGGSE